MKAIITVKSRGQQLLKRDERREIGGFIESQTLTISLEGLTGEELLNPAAIWKKLHQEVRTGQRSHHGIAIPDLVDDDTSGIETKDLTN